MKTISLFDFDNYKAFFNEWIKTQKKGGRGEYRRLALHLEVSTTLVSQVFKGDKQISLELACDMAEYLNLKSNETDYFILLVEYAKAGSFRLKQRFGNQIKAIQGEQREITNLMKKDLELSADTKSEFYSSWIYSAIRMTVDVKDFNDAKSLAEKLNLPRNLVQKVLDFLIRNQLVVSKDQDLKMGPARTHIERGSPHVIKHHHNWRMQGMNRMMMNHDSDLFFTGTIVLSREVEERVSKILPDTIKQISEEVGPSESEVTRCLNIDWFKF